MRIEKYDKIRCLLKVLKETRLRCLRWSKSKQAFNKHLVLSRVSLLAQLHMEREAGYAREILKADLSKVGRSQ